MSSSEDKQVTVVSPELVDAQGKVVAPPANTVATIGLILTALAAMLCSVMFGSAAGLPSSKVVEEAVSESDGGSNGDAGATESDTEELTEEQRAAADAERSAAEEQAREAGQQLEAQRLRVLLLASATAVLNLVGLGLSIAGLFVPHRPRGMAICGTVFSLLLFAGMFGVLAVGSLMDPG